MSARDTTCVVAGDRPRDRGQILTLVLAFVAFGGLVATAIMSLTTSSLSASHHLRELRDQRYAAVAAIDTHIEYLSNDSTLATTTGTCPSSTVQLNGQSVTVTCANTGSTTIGRELVIDATVAGKLVLTTEVFIDAGSDPDVWVNGWTYGRDLASAP